MSEKLVWEADCRQVEDMTGVPWSLLDAVIAEESGGQPAVVSKDNAIGLMQIIPKWHPFCGGEEQLLDPFVNIHCGAKILKSYHNNSGDPQWVDEDEVGLALASYSWGPGNAAKNPKRKSWPAEVQQYVKIILELYWRRDDRKFHN